MPSEYDEPLDLALGAIAYSHDQSKDDPDVDWVRVAALSLTSIAQSQTRIAVAAERQSEESLRALVAELGGDPDEIFGYSHRPVMDTSPL